MWRLVKQLIVENRNLLNFILNDINDQDLVLDDTKLLDVKENIKKEIPRLIIGLDELSHLDLSHRKQLNSFITDILKKSKLNVDEQYNMEVSNVNIYQKYLGLLATLGRLKNELKRANYLSVIADKNVVLIGGNGVGKSAFAAYLRDTQSEEIVVIPAQKLLLYDGSISSLQRETKNSINNTQKRNLIGEGKKLESVENYKVSSYQRELVNLFSKLITAIVNEQISEEHSIFQTGNHDNSNKKTILNQLKNIWEKLIPDIDFEIDTIGRTLIPIKNGIAYNINSMSDGEKSILFYICQVLLAEQDSYIIVDEPETFLNTSTYSRLWDNLESVRSDCRFIYISHNIDFIVTRNNVDLMWCQEFNYPNDWTLRRINDDDEISKKFPKQLLTEILGVRKPVLFCEGTKEGLDFSIYNCLFNSEFIICPVGGHNAVIQYTRAYNASPTLNGNQAFGLIDGDWMEENQVEQYKRDGIWSLPFNEVEMLLLTDEIMSSVLEVFNTQDEIDSMISNFKDEFFKKISLAKEKVVEVKIKKYLDYQLSNFRINDKSSNYDYENQIMDWVKSIAISDIRSEYTNSLEEIINKRQYSNLLKVCPQKKEISVELANKHLDSKYESKAIRRVKLSVALRQELRGKYFPDFPIEKKAN